MYEVAARRPRASVAPADGHRAGVGLLQAGHQLEQGGLAAAGRPHHGHAFAGGHGQVHPGEGLHDAALRLEAAHEAGGLDLVPLH